MGSEAYRLEQQGPLDDSQNSFVARLTQEFVTRGINVPNGINLNNLNPDDPRVKVSLGKMGIDIDALRGGPALESGNILGEQEMILLNGLDSISAVFINNTDFDIKGITQTRGAFQNTYGVLYDVYNSNNNVRINLLPVKDELGEEMIAPLLDSVGQLAEKVTDELSALNGLIDTTGTDRLVSHLNEFKGISNVDSITQELLEIQGIASGEMKYERLITFRNILLEPLKQLERLRLHANGSLIEYRDSQGKDSNNLVNTKELAAEIKNQFVPFSNNEQIKESTTSFYKAKNSAETVSDGLQQFEDRIDPQTTEMTVHYERMVDNIDEAKSVIFSLFHEYII